MRLVVHECNALERAKIGKECETRENMFKYINSNLFALSFQRMIPDLQVKYGIIDQVAQKFINELDYTIPPSDQVIRVKDIYIV